jgi:hypothetical protein
MQLPLPSWSPKRAATSSSHKSRRRALEIVRRKPISSPCTAPDGSKRLEKAPCCLTTARDPRTTGRTVARGATRRRPASAMIEAPPRVYVPARMRPLRRYASQQCRLRPNPMRQRLASPRKSPRPTLPPNLTANEWAAKMLRETVGKRRSNFNRQLRYARLVLIGSGEPRPSSCLGAAGFSYPLERKGGREVRMYRHRLLLILEQRGLRPTNSGARYL